MHRHADVTWTLPDQLTWEQVNAAILMDIRHQLRELNQKVSGIRSCPTVLGALQGVAEIGRDIRRRERAKRKRRRKAK